MWRKFLELEECQGGQSAEPGIGGLEKAVRRGFQAFVVFLEQGESIEVF